VRQEKGLKGFLSRLVILNYHDQYMSFLTTLAQALSIIQPNGAGHHHRHIHTRSAIQVVLSSLSIDCFESFDYR
jgi:hypothetical protein